MTALDLIPRGRFRVVVIDEGQSDAIFVIMPMRGENRFSSDFLRSLAPRPLAEAAE